MSEPTTPAGLVVPPAPETQIPEIDRALASLASLPSTSLAEHQERLSQAHTVLHQALNAEPPAGTA